jgi:hypothetical protein
MVSWDTRLASADMKQLRVGHDVLRWVGAISIFIACAFGAHAQTAKVEGFWVLRIEPSSELLIVLQQMEPIIWGQVVIGHANYPLTGTLKSNEIMFRTEVEGQSSEFMGEVKGDMMEGSVSLPAPPGGCSVERNTL